MRNSHLFSSVLLGAILLTVLGCTTDRVVHSTANFRTGHGFSRHQIVVDGKTETVWVFIPRNYQPTRPTPAVLFLHGLFEAGTDGKNCLSGGLAPVIAEHPEDWRFITIFPQSDGTWRGPARDRLAMGALDYVEANYSIDQDRVILAGLSYGALGTWEIGANHADRFAALVPVSGHRATDVVAHLLLIPVWAFCFTNDHWVNPHCSQDMCRDIDQQGGFARLTQFIGAGHDGWDQAVNHSQLVLWMLDQRRHQANASRAVFASAD